jgi:hypothetical protein
LNQTEKNWVLTVIHDGPNLEFVSIMKKFIDQLPKQMFFHQTKPKQDSMITVIRY